MPNPPWQGDLNILIEQGPGGPMHTKNFKMVCIGLSMEGFVGGLVSACGNITMHFDVG